MQLREASNQDVAAITALIYQVLDEYGLTPDPEGTDKDLTDIEKHYTQNGGYFGVVETDGQIVATTGLLKKDVQLCELRKMYSLPAFRGKGHGKWLLQQSLGKAEALGFSTVTLETATVLKEAIGLYKRFGFEIYQPENLAKRCDLAMIKYLTSATSE